METQEDSIPEIKLGGFVFTDQQSPFRQANDKQVPLDNTRAGNRTGFDFRRPEAYERMEADKLGQELAHDATIWRLYLEEADEHDQELVKGRHASLDMLLLFAALFSAILTAFLIESKDLLQQDPADVSMALMLAIVQSQYRMEQGASSALNATASPPAIPDFTPSMTARWINGIWFTSLTLSLSAALVAMLGKEWLTAFLASRPRPVHAHALLRQSRLEGLNHWWALHIIALLPSLLHVSLLLFAIGLVLYLSTMDTAIAVVIAAIVGVTSLFYVVTATLGAIYEFCPFVTELSRYVQRVTKLLLTRSGASTDALDTFILLKNTQALLWLAKNARDPAVVDCSYQAFSGLPYPASESEAPIATSPPHAHSPTRPLEQELPMVLGDEETLTSLLEATLHRFERLVAGSPDMLGSPELSIARYMRAIARIHRHICYSSAMPSKESAEPSPDTTRDMREATNLPAKDHDRLSTFLLQLLNLTETLWGNSSRPLSAETYASVLASTADIIQLALPQEIAASTDLPEVGFSAHVIEVIPTALSQPGSNSQLVNFRAHYSRWLARATTLLRLHGDSMISITPPLLDNLLGAVATLARCQTLNPVDCLSTHQLSPNGTELRSFSLVVVSNLGISHTLQPDDLHSGPLSSLIGLLQNHPSVKDESAPSTCLAALKAYSALAPVLLQQALGLPNGAELRNVFDLSSWEPGQSTDMKWLRFITVRQVLLTIRYLGLSGCLVSPNRLQYLEEMFKLLYSCVIADVQSSGKDSYLSLILHGGDIIPLLEFLRQNHSTLSLLTSYVKSGLIDIAALQCTGQVSATLCETQFTPECFPPLIGIIGHSTDDGVDVQRLLSALIRRMRGSRSSIQQEDIPQNDIPAVMYTRIFTSTSQGFSALATAAGNLKYAEIVVGLIIDVVHLAAGQDPLLVVEPVELQLPAVPEFLDVVSLVARYCVESADHQAQLLQFSNDSLDLMKVAVKDPASRERVLQHSACRDLWRAIQALEKKNQTEDLMKRFLDAQQELGVRFEGRYINFAAECSSNA
ncbi:hypothetical protein FRC12_008047 [Ceratobasidium sp. 428]|nr:hypothetical protein FRC12_008047 [Ceratobasidium sp. 428]